jgi:TetR/AcrR family transcriptional regulator
VSEAALYRHFASKAQMFEGLIDFVDQSVIGLIRQVTDREPAGPVQASRIVALLLQFAEKNPGMSRVMIGDALVLEHERLQERINLLFDKIGRSASVPQGIGSAPHADAVGGLCWWQLAALAALCPFELRGCLRHLQRRCTYCNRPFPVPYAR